MDVVVKASFDPKRGKEVALALAEFIRINSNLSESLEVQMKLGFIGIIFNSVSENDVSFVDVESILNVATNVETFSYSMGKKGSETDVDLFAPEHAESSEYGETTEDDNTDETGSGNDSSNGRKNVTQKQSARKAGDSVPVKMKVLQVLSNLPKDSDGMNAQEIADVLGVERKKVACHLTALLTDGKIERVSRGKYKVKAQPSAKEEGKKETNNPLESTSEEEKGKGKGTETEVPAESATTQEVKKPVAEIQKQKDFKRYSELTEVELFAGLETLIDFSLTREENVERVLSLLYDKEVPEKGISTDLFTRCVVAVTIVPESVNWNTIDSNLEEYDLSVSEESKKDAEKYLISVFNKFGYTTTYLKFLKAINELFDGKYKTPDWPFPEKKQDAETVKYERIKVNGIPENEEFETFLGKIVLMKTAGPKIMENVVDFMSKGMNYKPKELLDIYEFFRVAYSLKKITKDYIFVNGKFTNSQAFVENAVQDLVNNFIKRISPEELKHIRYIDFVRELITAIRKA